MMPFITCNFSGRTGNQIFQMMTTMALAMKHGVDYKFPAVVKSKYSKKPVFENFPTLTPEDEKRISFEYNRDSWDYVEIPYQPNMRITGYFQNYRYFNEYRSELIELFNLPKEKIDAVCVHVRRGDYRRYPTKWPMLPHGYYVKALNENCDKHGLKDVHVFSDEDIREEWPAEEYFIAGDPLEDWIRMTQYKYFIIANSTFSWTAAYLSGSDNVIAPHHTKWYGPDNSRLYTGELILPTWKQIEF